MKEKTAKLKEKIEKDYKDMMAVINSTSLPLFVEDTIEDMHILIETLISENKELKEEKEELKAHQIIFTNNYKPIGSKGKKFISEDKIKAILEEYKYTEIGDSEKIIEFYKKIQSLLEKE